MTRLLFCLFWFVLCAALLSAGAQRVTPRRALPAPVKVGGRVVWRSRRRVVRVVWEIR